MKKEVAKVMLCGFWGLVIKGCMTFPWLSRLSSCFVLLVILILFHNFNYMLKAKQQEEIPVQAGDNWREEDRCKKSFATALLTQVDLSKQLYKRRIAWYRLMFISL